MAQPIAIYGKGGSGKTTIAANLATALAEAGCRTLLIGCSPIADSSHLLLAGTELTLTLATFMRAAEKPAPDAIITAGFSGVGCIEAGDFHGHEVCTARSVAGALQQLHELGIIGRFAPDYIIYDLPSDLACVGTVIPGESSNGLSLVVTAANFQAMAAANRYLGALARLPGAGPVALIANGSVSSFEDSFVADFAGQAGVPLAATIPRSLAVRYSELYGKTVIEAGPLSNHAYIYRKLARKVTDGRARFAGSATILPLAPEALKKWAHDWGAKLGELEFGIMQDGAGI